MKLANKVLAVVLCAITLVFATGCGQKDRLLPFGLKFGDNYEKVQKAIGFERIEESDLGYISAPRRFYEEKEIEEILGTSEGISDVRVIALFNADKELYQYVCFFLPENDRFPEIIGTIRQKYDRVVGEEGEVYDGLIYWSTEKYDIFLANTDDYPGYTYSIMITSFEHDIE